MAARAMVNAFQTAGLKVAPSLKSRHIDGHAIDVTIRWDGTLVIQQEDGKIATIENLPRDGTHPELIRVGATYGVIHFINVRKDRAHWSTDGK